MSDPAVTAVLFRNVRIFDGKDGQVSGPRNVIVSGEVVSSIREPSWAIPAIAYDEVIDGGGTRVLMPGLIDAH